MKLSILIPTYNRSLFLKRNLDLLKGYLRQGKLQSQIEIVISNNNSSDETDELISNFKIENQDIDLKYFLQRKNIGLEKNALLTLNEAKGEYVMYLGDDDYIEHEYLEGVIEHVNNFNNTYSIIPSWVAVNINGKLLKGKRDTHLSNKLYKAGFKNCIENSWRGHQLSGLVFRRTGLYDSYIKNKVSNIYLFIYFTSISCIEGDTFHFTKYPVKITSPGQENKDWNYGEDGLLLQIFDNYNKLPFNSIQITLLQLKFINEQPWRLWGRKDLGFSNFSRTFRILITSKKLSIVFKLLLPLFVIGRMIRKKIEITFKAKF